MTARRKRVGLDALGSDDAPTAPEPAQTPPTGETATSKRKRTPNPNVKQMPVYLPMAAFRQLRALRFEESDDTDKSYNSYMLEGLDRIFRDRGLKTIAELEAADDAPKSTTHPER